MTSEWKPIESAPRDGTLVIVRTGDKTVETAWYWAPSQTTNGWMSVKRGDFIGPRPQYWMPLPLPPSGAAVKG